MSEGDAERHTISMGAVPAGSRFIRRATLVEYAQNCDCLLMFETADKQHIWMPRDRLPDYGVSPMAAALPDLKAFNALPADERANASAELVISLMKCRDQD